LEILNLESGIRKGDAGLKRCRELAALGFFALLLAAAAALSSAPAAATDGPGLGQASHPDTAFDDSRQAFVIRNADAPASNLSRIDPSSPHGIVPGSMDPMLPEAHGLGIAGILPVSARENGFHSLLRAPPVSS